VLRVANFNMHTGIDGWGRPFDYVGACRSLDADVIVLQETWRPEGGAHGQPEEIAAALGYTAVSQPLSEGYRIALQPDAPDTWMPRLAFMDRYKSLYFDTVRPIAAATLASARFKECEKGMFGLAVLLRAGLVAEATRVFELPVLSRDRIHRAAILIDLTVEGQELTVVGTHMAHLQQGSMLHYRRLRAHLESEARPTAVLSGDMNLWGPPVRYFLRGWHRAVRGATWPAWKPHSQIDHILVRGSLAAVGGGVQPDAGSDHRPVVAALRVG
jgi:endonuclease/exonuclease/phosphatase family metal-dependent hydrolase